MIGARIERILTHVSADENYSGSFDGESTDESEVEVSEDDPIGVACCEYDRFSKRCLAAE